MKLLPLRCPRCNHALAPGQEDVVIQCPNCHAAVGLNEGGLNLLPVLFATATQTPPETWLPFWVYRGEVRIITRRTQGGRSAEEEAREFWGQPRRIYIPAWAVELAEARDIIRDLLLKQPALHSLPPPEGAAFIPITLTPEDGRKLVELVIVSIEAGRRDWMQDLEYDLLLDSQALWLLPAEHTSEGWSLLVKGV